MNQKIKRKSKTLVLEILPLLNWCTLAIINEIILKKITIAQTGTSNSFNLDLIGKEKNPNMIRVIKIAQNIFHL